MSLLLALLMIISTSLSAIAAEADIGMPFTDVEDGAWYAAAICWAVENGVVNGYGDGSFRPNDPVTREQLAVMLYRNAQT